MAEEQKSPAFDPEALQVDVRLLGTPQGKLIGLATVEYYGFRMDNFKVFNGENGLFLGEPTIRDTRSNGFVKTIHVRGEELRAALNQKIISFFMQHFGTDSPAHLPDGTPRQCRRRSHCD